MMNLWEVVQVLILLDLQELMVSPHLREEVSGLMVARAATAHRLENHCACSFLG